MIDDFKKLLKTKSGKKLAAVTVIVFLFLTGIVFFLVYNYYSENHKKEMEGYLTEIPNIIETNTNELQIRSDIYESDAQARASIGRLLYEDISDLSDEEKLKQILASVSADSVSLLDEKRAVIASTGPVSPKENFAACIETLEPEKTHLEIYTVSTDSEEKAQVYSGEYFVLLPAANEKNRSLVFEFSSDRLVEEANALDSWSSIFEQMLAGAEAVAAAKTNDQLEVYPLDSFSSQECSKLNEELTAKLKKPEGSKNTDSGSSVQFISLLDGRYQAAVTRYEPEDTDIILLVPMKMMVGNGVFIAAVISAMTGVGMLLLIRYIYRQLLRNSKKVEDGKEGSKLLFELTCPGLIIMLAVLSVFSSLLLLLEVRTFSTLIAMSKRTSLQNKIELRQEEEETLRSIFADTYRSRTAMLTEFLAEHPDYANSEGLAKLNDAMKTDYLMCFDRNGDELFSSNNYTGFSVEKNMNAQYQAVLLGYPDAVVGPEADQYSNEMQIGAAIPIKDEKGKPDGFVLAVYDAQELSDSLERLNYENTVSNFAVQQGHAAAAISEDTGLYIAHTDHEMIGRNAKESLPEYESAISYEGFVYYKGNTVCISSDAVDGKMLLYIVPLRRESDLQVGFGWYDAIEMILLALLFYPCAVLLIANAVREDGDALEPQNIRRNPLAIFLEGYSIFLTLFAVFALIATLNHWWTSFDYVFSRMWTNGVHVYSIWAVLFIFAITFSILVVFREIMSHAEKRFTYQGKTVLRLISSAVTYTAFIFLFFSTLTMFGVNTAAMLASAGIISIAVGMGAQNLAADLLAGFFLILEGSIRVGDRVMITEVTGVVTDIGIRTTKIRTDDGNIMIINNSMASPVVNMGRTRKDTESKPEENKPEEEK